MEVLMVPLLALAAQDGGTVYLGWGAFTIQLGNFIVIAAMIVLFVLALVLPFPKGRKRS
jgi:large-conductance mechanosensitive channel